MCRSIVILTFGFYLQQVFTYTYDQRQTGDLNVQVDLKNLNLIALMKGKEDYVDYDYAYDYSDITIKPQNGTTKKPLNVTEVTTQAYKVNETSTAIAESSTLANISDVTTESIAVTENPTTQFNNNDIKTPSSTPQSIETSSNVAPLPDCKKGFYRNAQGICELRLQNPSNTLLKMIKQKPKANRGSNSHHPH